MGLMYRTFLEGSVVYACGKCRTHLATDEYVLSRQFQGKYGTAYLFHQVVNVMQGDEQDRAMTTGLHTIKDVLCSKCKTTLGWIYVKAYNDDNKYKEGKCVLESKLLAEAH
ncbi:Yippee/Mis18 [Zychaea mexicana]|uniref:Yippee/Mis18 n=1 Tax=Zychaea mexicana TaxID=64656 RepID=UPI0022FE3AEF|nr:Yippee/Mis18 [Zychaea mexicana]KAI9496285.1 Yippee/Mis18 [Zychaea mexicana]